MASTPPSPFSSASPDRIEEARRIEVRPRASAPAKAADEPEVAGSEVMLSFSCPSCLEMLAAAKSSAQMSVQCPSCKAFVMPPKVVSIVGSGSKTVLPPPRKSGTQALRK